MKWWHWLIIAVFVFAVAISLFFYLIWLFLSYSVKLIAKKQLLCLTTIGKERIYTLVFRNEDVYLSRGGAAR